jgi:hypothetical protein
MTVDEVVKQMFEPDKAIHHEPANMTLHGWIDRLCGQATVGVSGGAKSESRRASCVLYLTMLFACAGPSTAEEWKKMGPMSDLYPWPFSQNTYVGDLEFFPIRRQGSLDGCGLEFTLASRDWLYRGNKPFFASGSITLFAFPDWKGVTALALKLTILDLEPREGDLWGRVSPVASAYVSMGSDGANSLVLAPHTAETVSDPGSQSFLAWEPSALTLIPKLLEASVIRIWFNREEGEADLELPIRPRQVEGLKHAFDMCLLEVAQRVVGQISEELGIDLPSR